MRTPDVSSDEALAKSCVLSCLDSNHANTFPLLAILEACGKERPYREVEEEVAGLDVMHMTHQNPHVLAEMLLNCGGLKRIDIEEDLEETSDDLDEPKNASEEAEPQDKPVEYLLICTSAGQAALDEYAPTKLLGDLMKNEDPVYRPLFKKVIESCKDGAKTDEIEMALKGEPAMKQPKLIFAGYFISKLEDVRGIVWKGDAWHATESGLRLAAAM